jgi:hypothetical protein
MQALRGLSKADTLRLVEIEQYVKTGKRPDGLQVTDEWVDESMRFLAGNMRPKLEAWAEIADQSDKDALVALAARKLCRLWKRGVNGEQREAAFQELEQYILKSGERL